MLNVYICEDNRGDAARIRDAVEKAVTIEAMDMALLAVSASPGEILALVEQNPGQGAYFLDIDLRADMTGLELAERLRDLDPRGYIVFVTTHAEMSYLTFVYKVEAMDFIIKAVGEPLKDRVRGCLLKIQERHTNSRPEVTTSLTVRTEDHRIHIPFSEIILIETAEYHRITLHATGRQITFYGSLKDILDQLDGRFYRCKSSAIVNRDMVREIDRRTRVITLEGGLTCHASTRMLGGLLHELERPPQ